ncbi:glutamate--cysteine ligase regulatory subunit, putative [Pediculus humanus corporis]|uniref:GCS light chain n=1 Tax=Pediculus humanus subsp. corporis TaxID=121224 RepID=E0W2P2_PEDHC|nr:glutamate--cysteine ligase regulatory subunit, putative [Pediculus humanus corporis]EEB19898.1 glutamate--cysteine ligase regulatory subunit, putative [Pediculus humanus corporis]
MLKVLPTSVNKIFVYTGNILSLNEIKKLAGHNQTDELVESLRITLSDWQPKDVVQLPGLDTTTVEVMRNDKKCCQSEEVDRENLKVTVKIFVSAPKKEILQEALDNVFTSLNISKIDSLVLACKLEPSAVLSGLQNIWSIIEELAEQKKFEDVGVSDIDTDVFVNLYNWAKVKPTIIQINLAVCCVVPPVLQEFCKTNNVQLLTHSDPLEILPKPALCQLFGAKDVDDVTLNWALRFQVHVKCRGVLSSKGYLVCVSRPKEFNNV